MRVVALLAAYNESRFIDELIRHYSSQNVEIYLIDNCSTDGTPDIARRYYGHGVCGIETLPRDGVFRLRRLLERKEALAKSIEAQWFVHLDADEFFLPPADHRTLPEAFEAVERDGYNVVNFQEFTFTPTVESPDHDHPDFRQTMLWYYPFLPKPVNGMRAWKAQTGRVELAWSGGHHLRFPGLSLFPRSFSMLHCQFLSIPHVIEKYVNKSFDEGELQDGWHGWRARLRPEQIKLPSESELRRYVVGRALDASNPRKRHFLGLCKVLEITSGTGS
jgi:glycosyltransferase involved in cell wall biosynthesis